MSQRLPSQDDFEHAEVEHEQNIFKKLLSI